MILYYLTSMLLYCLVTTPFYVVIRAFILRRKRKSWRHEFFMFLFFLFCVSIFSQTIIPTPGLDKGYERSNFIPFETIQLYYKQLQGPNASIAFYNLAGNIILFVPFGFFIPLVWPKLRLKWGMIGISILIPAFIETIQYFIGRSTDIDDVILNTIAIIIGAIIFKCIRYFVNLLRSK